MSHFEASRSQIWLNVREVRHGPTHVPLTKWSAAMPGGRSDRKAKGPPLKPGDAAELLAQDLKAIREKVRTKKPLTTAAT